MPGDAKSLSRLLLSYELAFTLLIVVTASVGGVWVYFWQQNSRASLEINRLSYDAQQLRADLYRQIREVYVASRAQDPRVLDKYWTHIYDIDRRFHALEQVVTGGEASAIRGMRNAYEMLQAQLNRVLSQSVSESRRERIIQPAYEFWLQGEFESEFARLNQLIAERRALLDRRLARWNRVAPWLLPVPILLAVWLLGRSHRRLRREFSQPMAELKSGAEQISEGRLEHRVNEQGAEEVALLARTINQMAAELAASRDELVEKERQAALGALVPVVAHNIRNPLASIRASAQILDPADRAELDETRRGIIDTVDRLERWVSALLSYLHPQTPRRSEAQLEEIINGALAPLRARARDKDVQLHHHAAPPGRSLLIDSALMEQAIHGLVLNALEAAPDGSTIDIRRQEQGRGVVILIEDEGTGMPFDPSPGDFSPGPTTKRSGTGLGIPFAHKVIHAHGGTLEFEGRRKHGTRVRVTIPYQGNT
jgi:C4-dicarboxylate-specific signal transduction histidine kinase